MNTLQTRLVEIMVDLNMTKSKELASFFGVSEGMVSQLFSNPDAKLGPKPLLALGRTNYNLDWIATGKPPKFKHDNELLTYELRYDKDAGNVNAKATPLFNAGGDRPEQEIVEAYRRASPKAQAAVWTIARVISLVDEAEVGKMTKLIVRAAVEKRSLMLAPVEKTKSNKRLK